MIAHAPVIFECTDAEWPVGLTERLGESTPTALATVGPAELLGSLKTAILCSARTPGRAILTAHDFTRRVREKGGTVISGFHSPIEKECLRILLRGSQPIIICPARSLDRMRIPMECQAAFEAGRLLYLSPFVETPRRMTRKSAMRRNEIVAAIADEVVFMHIDPNGELARIQALVARWEIPCRIIGGHSDF